jgi:serine protease Do
VQPEVAGPVSSRAWVAASLLLGAVALLAVGYGFGAAARPSPPLLPSLAPLVAKVRNGVVGVTSLRLAPRPDPTAEPAGISAVHGSGFVLSRDGLVVTSRHLIGDPAMIWVDVPDHGRVQAKLAGEDALTDLALLRLDEPVPGAVELPLDGARSLRQGDWVLAVGDPYQFAQSVTIGLVSYVGRHLPGEGLLVTNDFVQISAPIHPGNSGGPVFDLEGNVAGVVTRTHQSGQGIGFAVPVRVLRWVVEAMQRAPGQVARGYLGIRFQPLLPRDRETHGIADGGALVAEVQPDQPAARAGIQPGDVLVAFGGQAVRSAYDLHDWITQGTPGQRAQVQVQRNGDLLAPFDVTLGALPRAAADPERPGSH